MQLKVALDQGAELLKKAGVPSPRLTAEVLLMHAAHCDRTHLYGHPERVLTECEWLHYGRYLNERLEGKPTQYITGRQEFWGMEFVVNPSVLIPRPETELVVETALEVARRDLERPKPCHIADVGTGSGCIAIALATELPDSKIYGLDCSAAALEIARRNSVQHGVDQRITFLVSDLLKSDAGTLPLLDMVVSNPPYVAEKDRGTLQREVRDYEPHAALFAGETGTDVYRRLIPETAQALRSGGWLVMELGYDSENYVREGLAPDVWESVEWRSDLAGIVRVVAARTKSAPQ
jgi:release factor glutamine methyltransferase